MDNELYAAVSTNKFNLLSVENWADILTMFDGVHFEKEHLMKLPKTTLCKLGCMVGGIDPASALCCRKLRTVASFMKRRSSSIYSDRYVRVKIIPIEGSDEVQEYDFDEPGKGVFDVKITDGAPAKIVHVGTGAEVEMPAEMKELGGKILNNYSDATAYFKGRFSDPLITRIFEAQSVTLPKPYWIKKITDFVDDSLAQDLIRGAGGDSENAAPGDAHVGPPLADAPAPMPPPGDGGAEPPVVGAT